MSSPGVATHLTEQWFRKHALIDRIPAEIREEELASIGIGDVEGVNSVCTSVRLAWASSESFEMCVAKRPVQGPSLRVCLLQRWLEREFRFYTEVVPWMCRRNRCDELPLGIRVPQCLAASWIPGEDGTRESVLVLERLAPPNWCPLDPVLGCSEEQAHAAVGSLAQMHGKFLAQFTPNESGSNDSLWAWMPVTPVHIEFGQGVQDYYANAFAATKPNLASMLSPSSLKACELMGSKYDHVLQQLAKPPWTLVHGDFRLENLRFSGANGDGKPEGLSTAAVAAFDWQFISKCRGAYDLAYFLSLHAPPQHRRQRQESLLTSYIDTLRAAATLQSGEAAVAAAIDVTVASLEDDIRAALLLALAAFINGAFTAKEEALEAHWRAAHWLGAAVDDWDCLKLLT